MGGKKTSYAKAMELVATKRGKYEKNLEDSRRRGDRFGINSAMRSISKLEQYEQQLFESQEQKKVDMGITPAPEMRYGGLAKFNIGGYIDPFSADAQAAQELYAPLVANPSLNFGEVDPEMASANQEYLNTYLQGLNLSAPAYMNSAQGDPMGNNADAALGSTQGLIDGTNLSMESLDFGEEDPMAGDADAGLGSIDASTAASMLSDKYKRQDALQGIFNQGKTLAPYAAQFAGDLYALNQLKNIEGPVNSPLQRATIMNTDVDTTATRARIQDNMRTFNAGVDSGLTNSAAVQNVKLANLAQTNRQLADRGQQEANQEMQLRNKQSALLTDNFNTNAAIDAANRQRLVDFNNMITNARTGIYQGMGVKAAQIGSEFAQRDLDKQRMDLMSRQFDSNLLSRQFSDLGLGTDPLQDKQALQQQINLLKDPAMGAQHRAMLERTNPMLLQRLDEIMATIQG